LITYEKKMEKYFTVLVLMGFVFFIFSISAFAVQEKNIAVTIDGEKILFDVKPYIDQQNRTMVPIRFIGEQLGFVFAWDPVEKVVSFTNTDDGILVQLSIGKNEALVNNNTVIMDTTAVIKNGRAMVPLRFVLETLGLKVEYDQIENIVNIITDFGSMVSTGETFAVVTKDVVNVRSGPGTSYDLVTQIKKGDSFPILGQKDDWYQITLSNNESGWVASWLIALHRENESASRSAEPGEGREIPETNSPPVTILAIDVSSEGEDVFISVTGNGKLNATSFTLNDPRRVVLDFPGTIKETWENEEERVEVNQGLVQRVRMAQFLENQVRVVVDVNGPASVRIVSSSDDQSSLTFKVEKPSIVGKTIVIDPGHASIQPGGWSDPGAIGPSDLCERDVVLDIALKVKEELVKKGANPILTRTGDTTLSLAGRAEIANQANADAFVSIHTNANVSSTVNGTSTYFYGNVNGQWTARQTLASVVQQELVKMIQRKDLGTLQANFAVLCYTVVPSILVETAFISNPEEERLLADPEFRTNIARGIVNGLERYFMN